MPSRLNNLASLIALSIGIDSAEEVGIRQHGQRNMKVTSALLTTMSGKLGGAVASKARGGIQYFRALVTPSNPRSTDQTRARLILNRLSAAWRSTLTSVQRDGWTALANDEESGIDVYVGNNSQLVTGGDAAVATAPASRTIPVDPFAAFALDVSAKTIGFTPGNADGDWVCNAYATAPQSASRNARQFPYRLVGQSPVDAVEAKTIPIPADHPAFSITVGSIVYVKFVTYNLTTGQISIAQEVRMTAVA
jgi:hypothetical protein